MKNLIIIPARSGSTRVKNKNLKELNGKPLISYSIKSSLEANCGEVIVSTNCKEIAEISKLYGAKVPFMRPQNLAKPYSSSISVIIHTLSEILKSGERLPVHIIFRPPTNPLLSSSSIIKMIEKKEQNPNIDSVLSIYKPRIHPFNFLKFESDNGRIKTDIFSVNGMTKHDIERSQDLPICFASSPACKVTNTSYFTSTYLDKKINPENAHGPTYCYKNAIGHEISSLEAQDIDDLKDFYLTEFLMRSNNF